MTLPEQTLIPLVESNAIVFAKVKDPLGFNLLRYIGTFTMNLEDTFRDYLRFDRIRTSEKTRPPKA